MRMRELIYIFTPFLHILIPSPETRLISPLSQIWKEGKRCINCHFYCYFLTFKPSNLRLVNGQHFKKLFFLSWHNEELCFWVFCPLFLISYFTFLFTARFYPFTKGKEMGWMADFNWMLYLGFSKAKKFIHCYSWVFGYRLFVIFMC